MAPITEQTSIPEQIARAGKLLYDQRLNDLSGGSISVRQGHLIYMTPGSAGERYLWDVPASEIQSTSIATGQLVLRPQSSREYVPHLMIYRAFAFVRAVVHAHPLHVMPFCAFERPIPAVIRGAQYYDHEFAPIADAPEFSQEQGEEIVACLRTKSAQMQRLAAAVLLPHHGVIVAAPSLNQALDCVERLDVNAYCVLSRTFFP